MFETIWQQIKERVELELLREPSFIDELPFKLEDEETIYVNIPVDIKKEVLVYEEEGYLVKILLVIEKPEEDVEDEQEEDSEEEDSKEEE